MFEQFFKHLFPRKVSSSAVSFSPTFYLGAVLVVLFISLTISGLLLLFYYTPSPDLAYDSVLYLEEEVFGGKFIRAFHRMCSHIFLITSALHLLRMLLGGSYKFRTYSYRLGLVVFGLIVFEAYAGYLLPMDQLSLWAAKTGLELVRALSFGSVIEGILAPDGVGNRLTLSRYFALHTVVIPFTLMLLMSIHMFSVRRDGLLSVGEKIDVSELYKRIKIILISVFMFSCVLSISFGAPLSIPADLANPPNPVKSAWFLLWIQEVVSWRAWYFNLVVLLYVLMFFLPTISKREAQFKYFSGDDKPIWLLILLLTLAVVVLTIIAMFFRGADWSFGLYL